MRQIHTFPLTVSIFCLVLAFQVSAVPAKATKAKKGCSQLLSKDDPLVEIDPKSYEYKGLTPKGLEVLKETRDVIQGRNRLFESEFRNLETIHHVVMINRIFGGNMFLYGPPGGAKSAVVNWFLKGETEPSYKLQLHQMITEQAFIGGQNFEAAKEGRFEINTEGSLADYKTVLLDEMEKGNPAALAVLLSLLNERQILAGGQIIDAKTEAVFSTSNANLPEIFQQFLENGQGSTAPALLNRFQFKAFVYNWLPLKDQAILDQREQRYRYLKSLAETHPEVLKDEVFLEAQPLNWPVLKQLANTMFKISPVFMTTFREFTEDMMAQTKRAIRESEERHQQNHLEEPFIYFPSGDHTERSRKKIPEMVLISAFLDFMRSPLATDKNIAHLIKNPIELDHLSLWRAYVAMTTIGPGSTKLVFNPKSDQKIDIDFGWSIDPSTARDKREELLIQNLTTEQERFRRTFLKYLKSIQEEVELSSRYINNLSTENLGDGKTSFELLMLKFLED
ncbi:MAG: AAA family ATPase [Bacteriovoracales bacterium]|nr:AAA family ATPase [Bacteriovoracales bacterium]